MKIIDGTNLGYLISKIKAAFLNKTDVVTVQSLDIDSAPTQNSNNLIKSGGVYDAINPSVQSSQPQGGMLPNVVYDLGELQGDTTFALAAGVTGKVNAYHWTFETGSAVPQVSWPAGVVWIDGVTPTLEAGKHYEVLVRKGYGSILVFTVPSA